MDTVQDSLLNCLVHLTQQNHRPLSAEVLRDGLPLENNKLTPKLFVRAAKRAGFKSRVDKRDLQSIAPLTLPVVLLLKTMKPAFFRSWIKRAVKLSLFSLKVAGLTKSPLTNLLSNIPAMLFLWGWNTVLPIRFLEYWINGRVIGFGGLFGGLLKYTVTCWLLPSWSTYSCLLIRCSSWTFMTE